MRRKRRTGRNQPFPLSGWKGGETGTDSENPKSDPESSPPAPVVDVDMDPNPEPAPDPPEDNLQVVFELGATQQALQDCRAEVAEARGEINQLSGAVSDLAQGQAAMAERLSLVLAEQQQEKERQEHERRSKGWERLLCGRADR